MANNETSGDSLTTKVENTYDDYGNLITYQPEFGIRKGS